MQSEEQRKRRFFAVLGMTIGTLCGTIAVVAAWLMT